MPPLAPESAPLLCSNCQACCCLLPVLLMPEDDPPTEFVAIDKHGLSVLAKADDGWCVALDRDSFRCTIYARRPQVCRDFTEGGSDCRAERDEWRRLADMHRSNHIL